MAMDVWVWVAVGVGLYWLGLVVARHLELMPASVTTYGPVTIVRTDRGRRVIERLARHRRLWRAWANVGLGLALVVMVGSFVMLLWSAMLSAVDPSPDQLQQPQNVLVIPGVNEFLPLEVAPEIVVGLVVGTVVHEAGHGLLCRVEDIEIESMGAAMLAIIPLGAFVEPDEADAERTDRGARARMFAAGVTNNFALTVVVFALLFGPVIGAFAVAPGAAVGGALPGSAAETAGIGSGDRITAVDGEPVDDQDDLDAILASTDERTVTVEVDGERTTQVERSLLVTASSTLGPADIPEGSTVRSVDGHPVHTRTGFAEAVGEREVVEVGYRDADGDVASTAVPVGALAGVRDGPMADGGAPLDAEVVITVVDGERVLDTDDLTEVLDARDPGETVEVVYVSDGERHGIDVTLEEAPDGGGFLGVVTLVGTSGMQLSDFGIRGYPAERYLAMLGGGGDAGVPLADSFVGRMVLAIFLPLASLVFGGALPYNFPGFTAETANFFVVEGPLGALGPGAFLLANVLFWTGWININLGFFNCIPAIPLDGGHILRTGLESLLSRAPVPVSERVVSAIVGVVALLMLASFLVLIFGAGILAP
ncbi:MAG: site-2 protease family protein [Halobacteriales archaeon]